MLLIAFGKCVIPIIQQDAEEQITNGCRCGPTVLPLCMPRCDGITTLAKSLFDLEEELGLIAFVYVHAKFSNASRRGRRLEKHFGISGCKHCRAKWSAMGKRSCAEDLVVLGLFGLDVSWVGLRCAGVRFEMFEGRFR